MGSPLVVRKKQDVRSIYIFIAAWQPQPVKMIRGKMTETALTYLIGRINNIFF